MDLKEFIKDVLVDIIEGIDEAKIKLEESRDKAICPLIGATAANIFKDTYCAVQGGVYFQNISFDVAVAAGKTGDTGGKVGVKVFGIDATIGGKSESNNSTITRIKFEVPIALQATKK